MKNPLIHENKGTPKDFFLWLGITATLYISAINLITLLFEYIRILFPDELDVYIDPYRGAMRFSIAALIVLFPLYIFLTRYANQEARKYPAKREIKVRKWLVYLTLFIASITLVVDLIVLINGFLGGELTTRFVLQIIVVFLVIGSIFDYYFLDLKGFWQKREKLSIYAGATAAAVVLVSVVAGFFIMGSPAEQRLLRLDDQKVRDLQDIQWQIVNYWQSKGEIPNQLSDLEDSLSFGRVPTDPETEEEYGYEKTGDMSFELCADFNLESIDRLNDTTFRPKFGFDEANWEHDAGLVCFERDIDPDLYPVREGLE